MKRSKLIATIVISGATGLLSLGQIHAQTPSHHWRTNSPYSWTNRFSWTNRAGSWTNAESSTNDMEESTNHFGLTPDQRMNYLAQQLNLTDQQKANVQAVFEQMRDSITTAVQEARTNADGQLQRVLSPEQYQKLQTLWAAHQRHFHGPWGQGTNANSGSQTNGTGQ